MNKVYRPKLLDYVLILFSFKPLFWSKNIALETGLWNILIFIISWLIVVYLTKINDKYVYNLKAELKKLRNVQHEMRKNNQNVSYSQNQKMKYQIISYDATMLFRLTRFILGSLLVISLCIWSLILANPQDYGEFAFSVLSNLFLLPLVILMGRAMMYGYEKEIGFRASFIQIAIYLLQNLINALFIKKDGKKNYIAGTIGLIGVMSIVLVVLKITIMPLILTFLIKVF